MFDGGWRPYVSAAERQRRAARELERLRKRGHPVAPVVIDGRAIAHTFWGKAWCDNLERYSDYASRLPRGRSYVRNGSVIDLQVRRGEVTALVNGTELYEIRIGIATVTKKRWSELCSDCAGSIGSLVELLQGRLSERVMERMCRRETGLFPSPAQIELACTCPDWASMCKHVAAALYGIGARLDASPELLFTLRGADTMDLIARAEAPAAGKTPAKGRILVDEDLSALFGLDLAATPSRRAKKGRGRRR